MIREKNAECMVCVRSEQISGTGERQTMETRSKGRLSEREGVLYVLYEENGGETRADAPVKNLLKIEWGSARASLKKSGAVSWKINFERGKRDRSEYITPYGALEIGVETREVKVKKGQEKTSLLLVYTLYIQGERQADCRLELEIL